MLWIEILHDVVGTSGYHCGVLRSFPVERIEQRIRRVLSLFSPSNSSESTSLRKSLRCWFGSSDRSPWDEHPFYTNRMVSDRRGTTLFPAGSSMRFNPEFEMALVQQAGLASAVKEPVVFDRIGEHVEITSTSSGVEQKFTTPIKKDVHVESEFLASIEPHTEPAYTIENCSPPYRHCIPILTVFKCFRNMPAAHVESDFMSRLGVGKRLLSNIFSLHVPVDRPEP
ncbi:hypothetical protein Tco_1133860 [Tanacetum coccineum]